MCQTQRVDLQWLSTLVFDWIEFMDYLNWKSAHKMTGQKEQVQASVHDSSRIPDIKLGIKNKQNTCILHRFTGILL